MTLDLRIGLVLTSSTATTSATTTQPAIAPSTAAPHAAAPEAVADPGQLRVSDVTAVVGAWVLVVAAASLFPLDVAQVEGVALFVHLISMAVGFGSVIMVDVYGLLWLFGHRTLSEVVDIATISHTVIALGVGGLLASGIALRPDLTSPLAQFKMLLVLVLMLNGVAAQRMLQRMKHTLPPDTRGGNIPWAGFKRITVAAVVSQSTWWGAITIGFLTNANRHG